MSHRVMITGETQVQSVLKSLLQQESEGNSNRVTQEDRIQVKHGKGNTEADTTSKTRIQAQGQRQGTVIDQRIQHSDI